MNQNALTHLWWPEGIFVDRSESIYVADCSNNRIVRWLKKDAYSILMAISMLLMVTIIAFKGLLLTQLIR